MPFDNITKKHFDSGDYPEALRQALEKIDLPAIRARQKVGEPDGRLIGVGISVYCEQGAHGTSVYAGWGIPMGSVDDCVAQLKEHLDAGVQKIIFVPYKYQMDQVEIIAREIIPRLKAL